MARGKPCISTDTDELVKASLERFDDNFKSRTMRGCYGSWLLPDGNCMDVGSEHYEIIYLDEDARRDYSITCMMYIAFKRFGAIRMNPGRWYHGFHFMEGMPVTKKQLETIENLIYEAYNDFKGHPSACGYKYIVAITKDKNSERKKEMKDEIIYIDFEDPGEVFDQVKEILRQRASIRQ